MKALSIRQPWAWLICAGYKDIENRNWRIGRKSQHGPYSSYHQANFSIELPSRIYVHASKSTSDMDKETLAFMLRRLSNRQASEFMLVYSHLAFGVIIGEVDITGCVTESESRWFGGKYGLVLGNPTLYDKPIPCKGKLGFFEPEI